MSAIGVVAEFNPLHNGHAAHMEESRRLAGLGKVIAVMSGNFVQRGEPAIFDKWARTRAALLCGADVVIELPAHYALCGADYFARGAAGLLDACGAVSAISFGAECGDLGAIERAAEILREEPPEFKGALRGALSRGAPFAAARGLALGACMGGAPEGLFDRPNNNLAIEYVKALKLAGSKIKPIATHRKPGGPSATAARRALLGGSVPAHMLPENAAALFGGRPARLDDYSEIFRYILYTEKGLDFGEGLENRFRKMAPAHARLSDLLLAVKSKRYALTRLQRAAMRAVLGIGNAPPAPRYIRVLGFRRDGAALLSEMAKKARLPVLATGRELAGFLSQGGPGAEMLEKEMEAGDIYRLAGGGRCAAYRHERAAPAVIV